LEKKSSSVHVDDLLAILLMEGNFNRAMKIFIGSCMIHSAQDLHLIPSKCYGSHLGCIAMQVLLNCALSSNMTRQSWAQLVVALVDFHTC